ncbi:MULTISPECIES: SIR2 family protein [Undibacterium]|uniref:SIR2 family protein n=1 Tax=Undibacterium seohonense TaxID=1344950 RepID=A0ABR6X4M5_9BURK|nr:SIR2 family protein [Undibacterium seohonense]MBC3807877.1 SIR2 family protein [Undibacterium seohonense]
MSNDFPSPIIKAIESGNAILFLGAGASYDAILGGSATRITADIVRNRLSDEFLDGSHKSKSLMTVADYARSEASLEKVQIFIRKIFIDLGPAPFHLKIPTFRWRAIVSTNYDLVVERAYENSPERLQNLVAVTKDGDELEKALAGQNTVPYLKLHGCINNFNDKDVPIVLDSNEYAKFTKGRGNLVRTFKEWATQSPIIFCGYSLGDENIKEILFDIGDSSQSRDSYLYVDISFDEIQKRFWQGRRITPFQADFKGFLDALDTKIPETNRKLASLFSRSDLTISKWIPSHDNPSLELLEYLTNELTHVTPDSKNGSAINPKNFYCGLDVSFNPIYEGLDITRNATTEVLNHAVLDSLNSTESKLFVIKGYAGCGKSVLAKRVAIETSQLLDSPLTVWLNEGAVIRPSLVFELQKLVQSRIYFFIDDVVEHQESLVRFVEMAFQQKLLITIIVCARTNELNIYGQELQRRISREFEIHDLEKNEVNSLLDKLSQSKILGPLEQYSESERKIFIEKFYDQQLLVALHEITFGDSFEDILISEFEKIQPREAQQLYLDICSLHQSGVGVRAGLLSRISGLPISTLNEYLHGPLARVIRANFDRHYRDLVYKSRHNEIAKMVFSLAIADPEARTFQLIRILSKIDLDYSSDRKSYFELVKGRRLADLFERKQFAIAVFDAAEEANPSPSYLWHQRAILELFHREGSTELASEYLRKAEIENKGTGFSDAGIQHTKANLLRKKALASQSSVERERYRADARSILKPQLQRKNSHPEHLLGQVLLDELKDYFSQDFSKETEDRREIREQAIIRITNELSQLIENYLKLNTGDGPMTILRSEFLKAMGKQPQALDVLNRFHDRNPENTSITRVLGEALSSADKIDEGIAVLKSAVLVSPNDKQACLSLAKLLIKKNEFETPDSILSHLRRSFSDGDSHYEARLIYARCNLLYGDVSKGKDEFQSLRQTYLQNKDRVGYEVRLPDGALRRYLGTVQSKQAGYGFIYSSELRFHIFFTPKSLSKTDWSVVASGAIIEFSLGFSYKGPVAIDVRIKD